MEEKVYFHYTSNSNLEKTYKTGHLLPGSWFTPSSFKGLNRCQIKRNLELNSTNKGQCEIQCNIPPSQITQKGLTSGGFPQFQYPEALPIGKCISKCEGDINLLSSTIIYGTIAYLVSYLFTKDKTLSLKTGYGVAFLKFLEEALC